MIGFVLYALIFVPLVFLAWARHHDVFHPWMYLIPQCVFLNAVLPMVVFTVNPQRFEFYVGRDFLTAYQALTFGLTACLVIGVVTGATGPMPRWTELKWKKSVPLRALALAIGAVGFAAFVYGILAVGGLMEAYGRAYGGGMVASGYVREAKFVGVLGALLLYASRGRQRLSAFDWAVIALCVFPTLFHGLVGARRGPTFLGLVVFGGGYLYFSRKKIGLAMVAPGIITVGVLLLFLIANRNAIYLGSRIDDIGAFRSPVSYLDRWSSNEYLYGSSVVRYADETGYFYGGRELIHLVGRVVPHEWWPTAFSTLSRSMGYDVDLTVNDGIDPAALHASAGWKPARGSAPGFVGDLWLEFGDLSFVVAFLIGHLYGRTWTKAATSMPARLVYPLLVALSVYLIMQGLDPWLFRLLLFGIPAALMAKVLSVRPPNAVRRRRPRWPVPMSRPPGPDMRPKEPAKLREAR